MSDGGAVTIRPLQGHAEYLACHALQRRVWGEDFSESVPPALLWVAQRHGGIASGAFTADGQLIGFVFGLTGLRDGVAVHWSDMLAVHPAHRGRGIALALKLHQRQQLLSIGVERVQWTFEPLESRNAWLNFERLGGVSREYLREVYGEGDSRLHRGLGTDRLVVDWELASTRVARALAGGKAGAGHPPAQQGTAVNDVALQGEWPRSSDPRLELDAACLALRIPADIQALKNAAPALAREWRERTRAALEHYLARGWVVAGFQREDQRTSRYLLSRSPLSPSLP